MKLTSHLYWIKFEIINYWNKYIPSSIRKVLVSDNFTICCIVCITAALGCFIVYATDIPFSTYGISSESRGKMLNTCLGILGGMTALMGLFLTNKKLSIQADQNLIAINSNNDKRFGEAIGFLNNDNIGIALGGLYSLFQLAKDDSEKYSNLVVNILQGLLDTFQKKNKQLYNLALIMLCDEIFDRHDICFSCQHFDNLTINRIRVRRFLNCKFSNSDLFDIEDSTFSNCDFESTIFTNINNSVFENSHFTNCIIQSLNDIKELYIDNSTLSACKISCISRLIGITLNFNTTDLLIIIAPTIINLNINCNKDTIVETYTPNGVRSNNINSTIIFKDYTTSPIYNRKNI